MSTQSPVFIAPYTVTVALDAVLGEVDVADIRTQPELLVVTLSLHKLPPALLLDSVFHSMHILTCLDDEVLTYADAVYILLLST